MKFTRDYCQVRVTIVTNVYEYALVYLYTLCVYFR